MRAPKCGRVGVMAVAQIGPLTAVVEALATAVGAGVVLGGVAAGIWGLARGSSRVEIEGSALFNGYAGGGFGAVVALVDVILRYGVMK
jgi:hypothetical protein